MAVAPIHHGLGRRTCGIVRACKVMVGVTLTRNDTAKRSVPLVS